MPASDSAFQKKLAQPDTAKVEAVPVWKIWWTAATSAAARLVAIGSSFAVFPLALAYLGTERFGVLVTLTSFVLLFAFLDFGIGNALMNATARSDGKTDKAEVVAAVAQAYRLAAIICGIGLLIAMVIPLWPTENLSLLLGVSSEKARAEIRPAMGALVVLLAIGVPVSLAQRIQMGQQRGYWANLWQAGGSLLTIIAALIAIKLDSGLFGLLVATVGTPVAAQLLNSALFFAHNQNLRRVVFTKHLAGTPHLIHTSLGFFGLQVIAAITFQSGPAIISYLNGASQASEYAAAFRLYSVPLAITSVVTLPLWPAYSQAYARGDMQWVNRRFVQAILITLGTAGAITIGIYFLRYPIMQTWMHDTSLISQQTHLAFVALSLVTILSANVASLLNGLGIVRFQLWSSAAMAFVSIAGAIAWTPSSGPAGPVWSATIGLLVCVLAPSSLKITQMLRRGQ